MSLRCKDDNGAPRVQIQEGRSVEVELEQVKCCGVATQIHGCSLGPLASFVHEHPEIGDKSGQAARYWAKVGSKCHHVARSDGKYDGDKSRKRLNECHFHKGCKSGS